MHLGGFRRLEHRCSASAASTTGQGLGEVNIPVTMPKPNVKVSASTCT